MTAAEKADPFLGALLWFLFMHSSLTGSLRHEVGPKVKSLRVLGPGSEVES